MSKEISTDLSHHKIINWGDEKYACGIVVPLSKESTPESEKELKEIKNKMKEIFQ